MATKFSDPIIIYDEDYEGEYVLTAQKRPQMPNSGLHKLVVVLVVIVAVLFGFAILCRVGKKLLG